MNNCAESQTRICKAYITDCYSHLANSYNKCRSTERQILKKNIFDMLDRVKALLNNEIPKEEPTETETNFEDTNWFADNTDIQNNTKEQE